MSGGAEVAASGARSRVWPRTLGVVHRPSQVPKRALQEVRGVVRAFARKRLPVAHPAAVVDQHVLVHVAEAAVAHRVGPLGEAVPQPRAQPRQLLGVDVHQVAGDRPLVAAEAATLAEHPKVPEAEPAQHRVHRRASQAEGPGDRPRTHLAPLADALDAPLDPSRRAPGRAVRPAGARQEGGPTLSEVAMPEDVPARVADADHACRDADGEPRLNALAEQTTAVRVELGHRVSHKRALQLLWFESPKASSKGSLLVNNLYGQLS